MSIMPPARKIWWNEPVHKIEATWIAIALVWCLVLFLWMPYWHIYGEQNLSNESYKITPESFEAKAQAMVDKHKVRTETDSEIPVVAPPPGSDVYLVGRLWEWWPILELLQRHVHLLCADAGGADFLPGVDPVRGWCPDRLFRIPRYPDGGQRRKNL